MYKIIIFPKSRTLEQAQDQMIGFLNEFQKTVLNMEFTDSLELLNSEIKLVKENRISEYDNEILTILRNLKYRLLNEGQEDLEKATQREIDILAKDMSISNN